MNWFLSIVTAFAIQLTDGEKDQGCRAACLRSGYDGGFHHLQGCRYYADQENYELFLRNRLDVSNLHSKAVED